MKIFQNISILALLPFSAEPNGLPEPAFVLYGTVRNTSGSSVRVMGALNWQVAGGGSRLTTNATLAIVNGQSFYVVSMPFETRFAGNLNFAPSHNSLSLTAAPETFTRHATVNGVAATLAAPASSSFTFSKADRGRIERVDLLLPDPALDSDGDGAPDWAEETAGTDPQDPDSIFKASADLQPAPGGRLIIKWSSIAGKTYSIHRTHDLNEGFTQLGTNLPATAPENHYADSTATGTGPFFYRITVNE